MIEITQKISDKDYKRAIAIHYFGYKYTYINPILGLFILFGLLIITLGFPEFRSDTTLILFMLAAFLVLRPILYIQNVFKSVKSNKLSSNEIDITIADNENFSIQINGNLTTMKFEDLYAYNNSRDFLFLYVSRNQYTFLDKRKMIEVDVNHLVRILDSYNIKNR